MTIQELEQEPEPQREAAGSFTITPVSLREEPRDDPRRDPDFHLGAVGSE